MSNTETKHFVRKNGQYLSKQEQGEHTWVATQEEGISFASYDYAEMIAGMMNAVVFIVLP